MITRFDKDMDGSMEPEENGRWVRYDDHRETIAEKDREIAKWKAAHDEMVSRNRLLRDSPGLPVERTRAYDEWMNKYHALMAQAVQFAERLDMYQDSNVLLMRHRNVDDFLASPEVQAWQEEKGK